MKTKLRKHHNFRLVSNVKCMFNVINGHFQRTMGGTVGRVKSGNFGRQVNSDSDLVCFMF